MTALDRVRPALAYIDAHLDEALRVEDIAARFHFSPYYFHRVFTLVAGERLAAYVRRRRLGHACALLHGTPLSVTDIALCCGFGGAQAFARAFGVAYGMTPSAYRAAKIPPDIEPVESLIRRFTNRLQGGMTVNPRIIRHDALRIAGNVGPGDETARIWADFEARAALLTGRRGGGSYEARIWDGRENPVYVGYDIRGGVPDGFALLLLPAGEYAVFEVFVDQGYDSENDAMRTWLASNGQGYRERLLDGRHFVVEFYDARFRGEESGSIVEIWAPVERG